MRYDDKKVSTSLKNGLYIEKNDKFSARDLLDNVESQSAYSFGELFDGSVKVNNFVDFGEVGLVIYNRVTYLAYLLTHLLIKKDLSILEELKTIETEGEGETKFVTLLALLQLFSSPWFVSTYVGEREFYDIVEESNLENPLFEPFHYINYLTNRVSEGEFKHFNPAMVRRLYGNCDIATDEKINETKAFIVSVSDELIKILKTGIYDELFIEYFKEMAKYFESEECMVEYVNCSTGFGSIENNLITQKLLSLGFKE